MRKTHLDVARKKTVTQWAEIADRVLSPTIEQEVEEIRALGAPKGDKDWVDAILNALEEGVEKVEEHPLAMAYPGEMFTRSRKLATEYGLGVCGNVQ